MSSYKDSTEVLLRKARERRAQSSPKPPDVFKREKTGAEKMSSAGASIASGIRSPGIARRNSPKTGGKAVMTINRVGGLASGIKGARRAAPEREVVGVPLKDVEDDFEDLQERMNNRFRKRDLDFKENLLSPANKLSAAPPQPTFFDKPTLDSESKKPLSPVQANKILSPNKKTFFPALRKEDKAEIGEPVAPTRTVSRIASMKRTPEKVVPRQPMLTRSPSRVASLKESFEKNDSRYDELAYSIPLKNSRSRSPINRENSIKSPSKNAPPCSPSRTFSPTQNLQEKIMSPGRKAAESNITSPIRRNDSKSSFSVDRSSSPAKQSSSPAKQSSSPAKQSSSPAKQCSSPAKQSSSPAKQSFRQSPYRTRGSPLKTNTGSPLKSQPSIRVKPNSVVSRALAMLENRQDPDDEGEVVPPVPTTSAAVTTPAVTTPAVTTPAVATTPATPAYPDVPQSATTQSSSSHRQPSDDTIYIADNIKEIASDLEEIKQNVSDEVENGDSDEEEDNTNISKSEKVDDNKNNEDRIELGERDEGEMDADDSLYDLCDELVPTEVKDEAEAKDNNVDDDSVDDEWMDVSEEKVADEPGNTSLKREADCLADSVLSRMDSFRSISSDYTPQSKARDDTNITPKLVLSPSKCRDTPPVKKLRRSMSVSDMRTSPSSTPSRFIRHEHIRSSYTATGRRDTLQSVASSVVGTPGTNRRAKAHRGPLEEGTLELRPPFEQIKTLEQGIMVQRQLESQALQALNHCTYGLEQVEAEKVLLVAGLKKELWKYHLNEIKSESHVFSTDAMPKGSLEISNVQLLLRQDYLVNQVVDTKRNEAFFLAVKVPPYRIMTTGVATSECNIHNTNLTIPDPLFIDKLPPDYKLTLEVYTMSYNLLNNATPLKKKKLDSKQNTPKRLLQTALYKMGSQKSRSERAFSSSLDSFRSGTKTGDNKHGTKFVLAGSLTVTIKDVKLSQFRLRRAPFHSPFEGTINLQMAAKESMSTEPPTHKGFLTIFQEESRLGAWNRRWCSVQDNKIYYWLYPEDEINQNKAPHGEIDLRHCMSEKVAVASRLECARPNTFVLVTQTTSKPGDRCSIITETSNNMTQTKYLLCADSREERKEWIDVLNQCLLIVTSWNTK